MAENKQNNDSMCWEVTNCPAGLYLICDAYKKGLNCFEIFPRPCCKREKSERCRECEVFIKICTLRGLNPEDYKF